MSILLVDISNAMHRVFWTAQRSYDGSLASNILLQFFATLNKAIRVNNITGMIAVFDHGSWRRKIFPGYKIDRRIKTSTKSTKEIADQQVLYKVINATADWFINKSNVLCLKHSDIEADDWISFFIRANPELKHVIFSSDGDFHQLLSNNVILYDAIKDIIIKDTGIYRISGQRVIDKEGKELPIPETEWELFLKCMRGDVSDSIPSAFPGARIASTKKRIGLREAYDDRINKAYNWNSVMLSEWDGPDGIVIVRDMYERNRKLIDLSMQPDDIVEIMAKEYLDRISIPKRERIGIEFLKFIGDFGVPELKYNSQDTLVRMFNNHYINFAKSTDEQT